MDPYEQRLREEVLYLHELWRRGPPRSPNWVPLPPANRSHFPLQQHCSSSANPHIGRMMSSEPLQASFNPECGFSGNDGGVVGKGGSLTAAAGGKEWPVPETNVDPSLGYSEWTLTKPQSSRKPPTAEEAAQLAVLRMQQRVSDSFRELLAGSEGEEADEEEENVAGDGGLEGSDEYKFFLDVFVKDKELRDYYEKNNESGEFCCFVCGGEKMHWKKKIKTCDGLLHHAMSIAKTNRKRAHRALGLVICKVLGWDVDSLPAIVSNKEPLSRSLASAGDVEEFGAAESTGTGEKVSLVVASGPFQLESNETSDVKKNDIRTADSDASQSERVGNLGSDKSGLGVAENSIKDVDMNHENDETKKGQALDHEGEISIPEYSVPLCASGAPWPCSDSTDGNIPPTSEWEWPSIKLPSNLVDDLMTDEEKGKLDAERKILEACRDFFHRKYGPEYNEEEDQWEWMDEDEEEEKDDAEDDDNELIDEECEEFRFFVKLFLENANLRRYYEGRHEDGDFLCLVCGSVRKKAWRRFKGCIGLLQHSNTVWKVKKAAHRAYARAVCKVLGWDIDALPKIVAIPETLSQSLEKTTTAQGEAKKNDDHESKEPENPDPKP